MTKTLYKFLFLAGILLAAGALVPSQAHAAGLTIDVKARNERFGGDFVDPINTAPGDFVRVQIKLTATGSQSVEQVQVRNLLPAKLKFSQYSLWLNGVTTQESSQFFGGGMDIGTLQIGQGATINFLVQIENSDQFPTLPTTLTNSTLVRGSGVSEISDLLQINVGRGGTQTGFTGGTVAGAFTGDVSAQTVTAFNSNKGTDATAVTADPGDVIVYTLRYKNPGQSILNNVTIENNISDIMQLATVVNMGSEAVVDGGVIKFAPLNILPGTEVIKTFAVKIHDAKLFPSGSDLVMTTNYGNELKVAIRGSAIAGAFTGAIKGSSTVPPRTGPAEWLAVSLSALTTAGYWIYRRRMI